MNIQVNMESEINHNSFSDYLRRRYPTRPIVFDIRPYMLDELIVELRIRNFNTIGEIDQTLDRTEKAAEMFERDNPPNIGLADSSYSAIGIVRMSMLLLDDDFFTFKKTIFDDSGFREKLAEYRKYILPEAEGN